MHARRTDLPALLRALQEPARYPHAATAMELLETHGAWVLLAGDHAYKIKKPVCLPFMDFSTLGLRRAACQAEVRLNRRFETGDPASHLYLEVLPIVGTPENPAWGRPDEDDESAFEYAVHMRRFDQNQRLDHLCQTGALRPAHLTGLARRMADFQARSAFMTAQGAWGQAEDMLAFAQDNLAALQAACSLPADRTRIDTLATWTGVRFAAVANTLAQRRTHGRVREGHGDLHLANLVLIGDEVVPFDGIEFNDALRWIDVASDIAFTWMDLQGHERPGLANLFLSEWLDASGDTSALWVLPFFAVYRALVRAKVAAIRSDQPGAHCRVAQNEAHHYLALAGRIAQPGPPRLLITHGLSGSGKTHASSRWLLLEASGRAIRLRSDVERKRLHGLDAHEASGSGPNDGLYSPQANLDTYDHLLQRARGLLQDGWTVLVDAAFLRHRERADFGALAQSMGCPFHILAPEAPLAVLRERIRHRQAQGQDASEATLEVLERQLGWLEPLNEAERACCIAPPA
ncbi:MAG: AAA family ATPase [Hydrogenophaga sp.]|uniref:bifunctional aminoglycoside phosphotransferase/ATP-binding protein n=1 Tax=Hydrogenophaga sp. TaxID=1904254 RepID=UPI003D144190